jgi:mono/diheme cytochrome c family protein
MTRRALAVVGVLAILALAGIALLYREVTFHGFSAREKPWPVEEFVALCLRKLATGRDARRMMNPYAPKDEILADARDHFAEHCTACHAEDGSGKSSIGEGMYPPATDLRQPRTQKLTDGELFQIIRNGIRFTGMPGWGGVDTDEDIWKLVLLLRHLPNLTADELHRMRAMSGGDRQAHHHEH